MIVAKFRIRTTAMALVEQVHIVEADDIEHARAKALDPNLHSKSNWDFCCIEDGSLVCDDVEEVEKLSHFLKS